MRGLRYLISEGSGAFFRLPYCSASMCVLGSGRRACFGGAKCQVSRFGGFKLDST